MIAVGHPPSARCDSWLSQEQEARAAVAGQAYALDQELGALLLLYLLGDEPLQLVAVGLLSLQSPEQPIGNPLFSILEILIIVLMPAMVTLMMAALLGVLFHRARPVEG